MSEIYYCSICNKNHFIYSFNGKEHLNFKIKTPFKKNIDNNLDICFKCNNHEVYEGFDYCRFMRNKIYSFSEHKVIECEAFNK